MNNWQHFTAMNAAGFPAPQGVYDPQYERDSCGVGFVAHIDATPDHAIVETAVRVLVNLEHRGAVGGDKSTGDGAGILMQLPDAFLRAACSAEKIALPEPGEYAAAM